MATSPQPTLLLADGVVALRPTRLSDLEAHMAGEDAEIVRWLNEGLPSTVESTTAWLERNLESWCSGGPVRSFSICDAGTGTLWGNLEVDLDWESIAGFTAGDANIAYQVYPDARGRGVAVRAVELAVEYLRDVDRASRAVLVIEAENVASLRVAARAGFEPDGNMVNSAGQGARRFVRSVKSQPPPARRLVTGAAPARSTTNRR